MIKFDPANRKGIVWLAAYPKSGSTWARIFLYNLSLVLRGAPADANAINNYWKLAPEERQFQQYFERFLGKPLASATLAEVHDVRPRVQALIAASASDLVMLKTHSLFGAINKTPTINAEVSCGAIYIVRDPRDVALSLANQMGTSVDEAIRFMGSPNATELGVANAAPELWGSWSAHTKSWTEGADDTLLVIRYEDMLGTPRETFGRLLAHIRHGATPEQVDMAIERSSFPELQRQEETVGFSRQGSSGGRFFATGKSGTWREKLAPAQIGSIISANDEMMRKFGYVL